MASFGARFCAVEISLESAQKCCEVEPRNQTPAQTPADPINHNDMPHFYSIKLLAKTKLITKMNNWTYISVITTTLNEQNNISENCIGSVIHFFILTEVPFVYMERAGFMTCTAASHQG